MRISGKRGSLVFEQALVDLAGGELVGLGDELSMLPSAFTAAMASLTAASSPSLPC
jgi:hypothetical protein